jgi:hypothetical protein
MPIKLDRSGSFEIDYFGMPFGGLNVEAPANIIPDTQSPSFLNFILRNNELRSRWNFISPPIGFGGNIFPFPLGSGPVLGLFSFEDSNGTTHTVCWSATGFWQLQPLSYRQANPNSNPWVQIPGNNPMQIGIPISYGAFADSLYWCNGNQFLQAWDGIATTLTATDSNGVSFNNQAQITATNFPWAIAPVSIGGYYLSELASHLLMARITATDGTTTVNYPQRLWWSSSGYAKVSPAISAWDITVNGTGGGYNDFLDTPDFITGLATTGIQGYLFRTNGISQFTPTGNGVLPFNFDHLWASTRGIGAAYPWSIASYGPNICFVSYEQIWQIGINSFQPIGGTARDAIILDLYNSTGTPTASIRSNLRLGYVYWGYQIEIPQSNGTKYYFFAFEDQNWSTWMVSGNIQTCRSEEVYI